MPVRWNSSNAGTSRIWSTQPTIRPAAMTLPKWTMPTIWVSFVPTSTKSSQLMASYFVWYTSNNIDCLIPEHNPLIKRYRLATGGSNDEIKIWIITSKSLLLLEKTLKNCSTGASSSSKHQDVSIHCSDSYEGHNSSVTFLAYSANGTYLVSSSLDKYVKIWDGDGNCMATLQGHTRYVNCVAFTKNFTLVVSGNM